MQFLISPGGSEKGLSYWSSVLPCPRAHWFRYRETERVLSWGTGCAATGKLNPLMVGTLFHAYVEAYYLHQNITRLEFIDGICNEPLIGFQYEHDEAWRLFEAYLKNYRTEVVAEAEAEVDLEDLSGELGVPRITSRVDMVAIHGPLAGCAIELPQGRYLWDHKTAGKSSSNLDKEHMLQLKTNCHLWNKQFPERPVLGGIVNNIVKNQTVKFERLFIPLFNDVERENLTRSLKFVYIVHEQYGDQMVATKSTCTGDWSPCQFYSRCWGGT